VTAGLVSPIWVLHIFLGIFDYSTHLVTAAAKR
jgi:hypothetical protein